MSKITLVLGVVLIAFIARSSCQRFIQPTYRPHVPNQGPRFILPTYRPPTNNKPVIRYVRDLSGVAPVVKVNLDELASNYADEEHLNRPERSLDSPSAKRGGGHSTSSGSRDTGHTHPGYNRRNARSVDSPSAKRGGGSPRTSSGSRNTGATHPGYNRRNAREIRLPGHLNPLRPKPLYPRPTFPAPVPRIPILARTARDVQISGLPKKPTHRDVIIPNWNPNARTNPWNRIGGRHGRSLDFIEDLMLEDGYESVPHERQVRSVGIRPDDVRRHEISSLLKKPRHPEGARKVNPNGRTDPSVKPKGRHARSVDIAEDTIAEDVFESTSHERVARDVQVSGLPKKPTHRDVIIPNWNPHVRTNPWERLGGRPKARAAPY